MRNYLASPRKPQVDSGKVGVTLVSVVYGIVLGRAFMVADTTAWHELEPHQWSHLAVAISAVVFSWVGYYNNRDEYPLWKAQFCNLPLVQYLISVVVLGAYWGLIVTIPRAGRPTLLPQAYLIAAFFVLYFAWDWLEVRVMRSPTYGAPLPREKVALWRARASALRAVTAGAAVVAVAAAVAVHLTEPHAVHVVVAADALYVVGLLAYRIVQERYGHRGVNAAPDATTAAPR